MYDTEKQFQGFLETVELLNPGKFSFSQFTVNKDAASLPPDFMIPGNIRLGQRMEYYLQALLKQTTRYDIIAKNLQIIENKTTLGEIDFILKDLKNNQFIHLEQVYKFYLFDPSISGNLASKWIGGNRRDSLDKKLEKLEERQLPLIFKTRSRPYLKSLGIDLRDLRQEVCFKGQLFLPINSEIEEIPEFLNKNAVVGRWYRQNEINQLDTGQTTFFIPPKNDWVSRPDSESQNYVPFSDFYKKISVSLDGKRSLLFWTKDLKQNFKRNFAVWW